MKHKNWALFTWAMRHLEIDHESNDVVYKKCIKNDILLKLMDLSGVKPEDVLNVV